MSGDPQGTGKRRDECNAASTREWRPLLNGEYPPPGPTKYGEPFDRDGQLVRPILVYAVGRVSAGASMSGDRDTDVAPEVGQVWQRRAPLKQRFRVGRVWIAGVGLFPDDPTVAGQTVVRLEPLNGGRETISTVPELRERCVLVEST